MKTLHTIDTRKSKKINFQNGTDPFQNTKHFILKIIIYSTYKNFVNYTQCYYILYVLLESTIFNILLSYKTIYPATTLFFIFSEELHRVFPI